MKSLTAFYQSGLCSDIAPAWVVQPNPAEDVSTFVKTIKPFAISGKTPFAIVGGGQQPAPGCSNIQDSNTLEDWGPVYDKLGEPGLSCCGGQSWRSGIGGLALADKSPPARGLSFVSSREGFIYDSVLNYEVVLASGSIIVLRGGGNNLGIVTRFDFRTFEQGHVYGGSSLVHELRKPDASKETYLMLSIGFSGMFGGPQLMCLNRIDESPELQPFTDIQPQIEQMISLRMRSLADAVREKAGDKPSPKRSIYMNATIKADVATLKAATELFSTAIEPLESCEGILLSFTLQPYPLSLLQQSATQGGNVLGLDRELDREDDARIIATLREALEKIDADATKRGTSVPFKYLNYAAPFQRPIESYGSYSCAKLRKASQEYDPDGLFQKGVPGGWKLFL
ncbi:FAD-binding domain-containing protein [Xylaria venustula]|nr:FAD-binding domain-containing protein [Xylaria venustula]